MSDTTLEGVNVENGQGSRKETDKKVNSLDFFFIMTSYDSFCLV